jgi:pimeloyl-ACP methyl ester carboxylesterase
LFVPGLASDARSFVVLMAHLAEQFRCIGYDLPAGNGDGARLAQLNHAGLVEDVFSLLDHLSIRQSYVFGASFGSTIALAAMHAQPERLPRGLLQAGFAHRPLAPAERWLARLARHWRRPMGSFPGFAAVMRRLHFSPFADCPADVWQWLVDRCGAAPVGAVAHRALLMHQLDLRPQLASIRQPILLVGGDDDPSVNRACEAELVNGLPNANRVELDRCGHYPQLSHAAVLAAVIQRFLTPTCGS